MRPAGRDHSLYFEYPRYPCERPPELDGAAGEHPVAVVGAGPVGVTAALELARQGVDCVVLDAKDTVNDGSRAICIARHSLECLQQLGLHERFLAKALPWTHGTSFFRERPVFRLEMPHGPDERFHPMYNLQQQYIEKYLLDAAMASPRIDLRWCSRVCEVAQSAGGAELGVQTPAGTYRLRARYVIAADGARSAVRKSLGLELEGDAYEGRYVIADIRMHSDYPTERRAFFDPPANPGLTVLVHKQPDDIWRVDYQLGPDADEDAAVREERIREKVAAIVAMLGEEGPWALEWWSVYKAYTLALPDYRCGRTLFAGDAAHLVPIFGVRGLNSGLADAMNAAWKLAAVWHGDAPEALLDSYSPERRGATMEVFRNAAKSTRFMTPPSRGYARMREAVLSLAIDHAFVRPLINPRQSEPYTYAASPLTSFPARDAELPAGPRAGAPLVNRRLADGSHLLDHLGRGFTGLYFSDDGRVPADLLAHVEQMRVARAPFTLLAVGAAAAAGAAYVPIADPQGRLRAAHGAQGGSFYLVRPDRHVAARWRALDLAELVEAFTNALARLSGLQRPAREGTAPA